MIELISGAETLPEVEKRLAVPTDYGIPQRRVVAENVDERKKRVKLKTVIKIKIESI